MDDAVGERAPGVLRVTQAAELPGHDMGGAAWGEWQPGAPTPVLAVGGGDRSVRLWRPQEASVDEPIPFWRGMNWGSWGRVDGRTVLATGSDDGIAGVWDPRTRALTLASLRGHTGTALWGAWRPEPAGGGPPLVTFVSVKGGLTLWSPATGETISGARSASGGRPAPGWGVWGTAGGRSLLALGGSGGVVRLWDPESPYEDGTRLDGHHGYVRWGAWGSVAGRAVLATGDRRGTVLLWDPVAGRSLHGPLLGHVEQVRWGAWGSAGGREVLATGGGDGTVRLWDPVHGRAVGDPLLGHAGEVRWGVWARVGDRSVLATGDTQGGVRLWDADAAAPLCEPLPGHVGMARWGAWTDLGGRPALAVGGLDGVRLWEVVEDRAVPRLPGYRSDIALATDELGRSDDALAVAELITARSAQPPLAVGLFGDWGEGKTHFLGLLEQHVRAVARPANVLAHSAVRQVRFNAWHYAETDLWASLIAELFGQLVEASDDDAATEQRRQSRLTAELVAGRGLRTRLHAARERRDELRRALGDPDRAFGALPPDQRAALGDLAGDRAAGVYRTAVETLAATRDGARLTWVTARGVPLRAAARLAGACAVLAVLAAATAWGLPALWKWLGAAPGAAAALAGLGLARRFTGAARDRGSAAWETARSFGRRQRERVETALGVADAEVEALQAQLANLTAAGQLAGLVADRASSADYRARLGLMTRIREDFRQMAALLAEANAGGAADGPDHADEAADLLPRIDRIIVYIDDLDRCPPRRVVEVLEAVHLLLAVDLFVVVVAVDPRWLLRAVTAHYEELMAAGGPYPAAADGAVDPDDDELWRSTPAQYLEKIFQVVLTLPPLDTAGYHRLVHTLVGVRAPRPAAAPEPRGQEETMAATGAAATAPHVNGHAFVPSARREAPDAAAAAVGTDAAAGVSGPDAAGGTDTSATSAPADTAVTAVGPATGAPPAAAVTPPVVGAELPPARVVERVDPLTLEPDELALLGLLGPPLLVATPRAVKRLANSYGLLTATRREHRALDLTPRDPGAVAPTAAGAGTPHAAVTSHAAVSNGAGPRAGTAAFDGTAAYGGSAGANGTRTFDGVPAVPPYLPYRAGMVLLAALVAYPDLGPALFLHLHHTAADRPHMSWREFRESLVPRQEKGRWRNPADPDMSPVRAQQWQAALAGLASVEAAAAERSLDLPVPLHAWAQWVVPVGRLSFPTGRIVNALDRQRPLAARAPRAAATPPPAPPTP